MTAPRIARIDATGEIRDLSPNETERLIREGPAVRREWLRWSKMARGQGRLVLLAPPR